MISKKIFLLIIEKYLCEDSSGILWIGTQNGLIKFNPETNQHKYYFNETNNEFSLSGNFVGKVYVDKSNTLWVGTGDCLHKYDRANDRFIRFINPYTINSKDKTITDILEDRNGDIWITTLLNGLQKFDRKNSTFTIYKHDESNPESIGSNILFSLYEDKTGILWIGTEGAGVNKLNRMR